MYPNPFSSLANISFNLTEKETVAIDIYNIIGEKVLSIENESYQAGKHQIQVNAENLSSGMYFVKLTAGKYSSTQKISIEK